MSYLSGIGRSRLPHLSTRCPAVLGTAFLGAEVEDLSVHGPRDAGGGRDIRAAHRVLLEFASGAHLGRTPGRVLRRDSGTETFDDAPEDRSHQPQEQEGEYDESKEEADHGIGAGRGAPAPDSSLLLLLLGSVCFCVGVLVGNIHAGAEGGQHVLGRLRKLAGGSQFEVLLECLHGAGYRCHLAVGPK